MAGDPSTWASTTHAWASMVDREHLQDVRDRCEALTGGSLRHVVLEVLAYAAEEAEALGRRGRCTVTTRADGSVAVSDDGRGTDTRRDAEGDVVRKPVMATRDLRFFDVDDGPLLADGRRRQGISVVSALSSWLVHTNRRADGAWTQRYEHGVPVTDLEPIEASHRTGTTVEFLPDATLLHDVTFDPADVSGLDWLDVTVAS
jgi:DNA gyrase subunit B